MSSTFTDQSIIITGASSGIGAEVARQLAAQGARLSLAARREPELQAVASRCRELGGEAIVIPTDVTDKDQCRHLVEGAIEAFGGLDMLINNAGFSMHKLFEELEDLSVMEELMQVNYFGAVYCTHYALPHLTESRGRIVVVSSITGKAGIPTRTGYSASKHALHGFFDALRSEIKATGISVSLICPNFVDTHIRRHGEEPGKHRTGMPVEKCARLLIKAAAQRRRELVMSVVGKVGQFLKPFAPGLIDRIARHKVGLR